MPVRFIRSALVLVMLATLSAACATSDPNNSDSDPTVEPSAGTPAAERTGSEPPAPGGGDKPAIETAGAPAGNTDFDTNPNGTVCMYVIWAGQEDGASAGDGGAFQVTEVRLSGAEPADFSSSCQYGEPCQGYTFDSNADYCSHAVRPGSAGGTLALYGRVVCSGSPQDCEKFRSNLVLKPIPIPAAGGGGGGESEEPEPEPSEEPAEPEPSTPADQPSPAE